MQLKGYYNLVEQISFDCKLCRNVLDLMADDNEWDWPTADSGTENVHEIKWDGRKTQITLFVYMVNFHSSID